TDLTNDWVFPCRASRYLPKVHLAVIRHPYDSASPRSRLPKNIMRTCRPVSRPVDGGEKRYGALARCLRYSLVRRITDRAHGTRRARHRQLFPRLRGAQRPAGDDYVAAEDPLLRARLALGEDGRAPGGPAVRGLGARAGLSRGLRPIQRGRR